MCNQEQFSWYKFLSRKFLLCIGCAFVCTLLLWFGKIDGTIFRDLIIATTGVFVAGNVVQKYSHKSGDK